MTTTNRLANDLDNILARTEQLWADLRGERPGEKRAQDCRGRREQEWADGPSVGGARHEGDAEFADAGRRRGGGAAGAAATVTLVTTGVAVVICL